MSGKRKGLWYSKKKNVLVETVCNPLTDKGKDEWVILIPSL